MFYFRISVSRILTCFQNFFFTKCQNWQTGISQVWTLAKSKLKCVFWVNNFFIHFFCYFVNYFVGQNQDSCLRFHFMPRFVYRSSGWCWFRAEFTPGFCSSCIVDLGTVNENIMNQQFFLPCAFSKLPKTFLNRKNYFTCLKSKNVSEKN